MNAHTSWQTRSQRTGGASGAQQRPKSVLDLKTIMQSKDTLATSIKKKYSSETAMDTVWSDQGKRAEFLQLRKEIKELNTQISQMA